MKDIREIIDDVLCSAFSDIPVCCEIYRGSAIPETYIVYGMEYENNIAYANGRPIRRISVVNVELVTRNINDKVQYIPEIERAMLGAEFTLKRGQTDLEIDSAGLPDKYYRTIMQFQITREVV